MSNYKIQKQDTNCPVCQLTVNGITRHDKNMNSAIQHYYKTTLCCVQSKEVHRTCSVKLSSSIESTYNFDATAYEGDNKVKLLCMKYVVSCFHFKKRHSYLGSVSVILCKICDSTLCYGLCETVKKESCKQMLTYDGTKPYQCFNYERKINKYKINTKTTFHVHIIYTTYTLLIQKSNTNTTFHVRIIYSI